MRPKFRFFLPSSTFCLAMTASLMILLDVTVSLADRIGNGGDLALAELYNAVVSEQVNIARPTPESAYYLFAQIYNSAEPYNLTNPPLEFLPMAEADFNSKSLNDYQIPDSETMRWYLGNRSASPTEAKLGELGIPAKSRLIARIYANWGTPSWDKARASFIDGTTCIVSDLDTNNRTPDVREKARKVCLRQIVVNKAGKQDIYLIASHWRPFGQDTTMTPEAPSVIIGFTILRLLPER